MMNDSVREELQAKITSIPQTRSANFTPPPAIAASAPPIPAMLGRTTMASPRSSNTAVAVQPAIMPEREPEPTATPAKRIDTARLEPAKTSKTLVGFQNKTSTVPDWRLQLQNAVQQRRGTGANVADLSPTPAPAAESSRTPLAATEPAAGTARVAVSADPRVAKALERIERSRMEFSEGSVKEKKAFPTPAKPYKFDVVEPKPAPAGMPTPVRTELNHVAKPAFTAVAPMPKPVTNRLPKISAVIETVTVDEVEPDEYITMPSGKFAAATVEAKRITIPAPVDEEYEEYEEEFVDEIDDLAPISMRFGAGLFDMIFAALGAAAIISPILFAGFDIFSWSGVAIGAIALSVSAFVYLTLSIAFAGRSVGMRLFGLELVDAVENEYPTLKQTAINSGLYVASIWTLGLGFVTILTNEERRAAHDLLSGTILVKEF
jgi:uncharacterized RDD family membrane protein YckC